VRSAPASDIPRSADLHEQDPIERVIAMAQEIDRRECGTGLHSQVVARYAEMTARELRLPEGIVEEVRLAGLLHDVGKSRISDAVISKPGELTAEEWMVIRYHPELGAALLDDAGLEDVREWILCHHERPDGTGYPRGLCGDEIPLAARILAVADAYEAMTNDRPYRRSIGRWRAREELRRCAGTQFDPVVVEAFLRALERDWPAGGPARVAAELREGAITSLSRRNQRNTL
jgi:putative nucleotidyltransferase with HDIG domain